MHDDAYDDDLRASDVYNGCVMMLIIDGPGMMLIMSLINKPWLGLFTIVMHTEKHLYFYKSMESGNCFRFLDFLNKLFKVWFQHKQDSCAIIKMNLIVVHFIDV